MLGSVSDYGNQIFRAVEHSILYEIINIQLIICSFQVPRGQEFFEESS